MQKYGIMQKGFEPSWINALMEDFPESGEIIDLLDKKFDLHLELLEDYYFCRQQIKVLKKLGKKELLKEYTVVFEELKEEIRLMLSEVKATSH